MVNVISGGAHAGGLIDVQDLLVVPVGARRSPRRSSGRRVSAPPRPPFSAPGGHDVSLVADEGGLAAPLPSNRAALDLLLAGIERSGLEPGAEVAIAVDIAATQFLIGGAYGLASENRTLLAARAGR